MICVSNFPEKPRNPEVYVPEFRDRIRQHVADLEQGEAGCESKVRRTKEKDDDDMRSLRKVISKEIPELPILVAAVGTKEEQHSPSPERVVRAPESKARFPRVYIASFGLEVADKCQNLNTKRYSKHSVRAANGNGLSS